MKNKIKEQSRLMKYLVVSVLRKIGGGEFEVLVRDLRESDEFEDRLIDLIKGYDYERYYAVLEVCANMGVKGVFVGNSATIELEESVLDLKKRMGVGYYMGVLRSDFQFLTSRINLEVYQNLKVYFDKKLMFQLHFHQDLG